MKEILLVNKKLSKNKIFNKIKDEYILTRRSYIKIPAFNKEIAYLVGVIAGDGSLTKTKRKRGGFHYQLRVYTGKREYLELLNNIIKKHFSLEGRIIQDKRKENAYLLEIKNATIFFYFVIHGNEIGKKKDFKIPKKIKKNKGYFLEYLAGLVDTDGHICNKRIQLKQKSERLLKEISKIANKAGLNCTKPKVNYTNNVPYYYIRLDNNLPLKFKTNSFLKQNK